MIIHDRIEKQAFAGQPINRLWKVIDSHTHITPIFGFPYLRSTAEALVASMDRIGIDVSVVSATIGVFGYASRGNDFVLAAMRNYPGRIAGYMAVDIGYSNRILPEMERCLAAGFAGIKIFAETRCGGFPYDDSRFSPVYEFANHHHLPVLAHTFSVAEVTHLEKQFNKYPYATFILAHSGFADRTLYLRVAREYPNVYLELCLSLCPRGLVKYFVGEGIGAKVLWGSDAVFMGAEQQIGRVVFAQISEAEKKALLGENARKLFRFTDNNRTMA